MAEWAHGHVGLHFIPPGEPWRNGYVESFNSRIGDECLNINSFWSLTQARVANTDWKHDCNHHRRFLGLAQLLCDGVVEVVDVIGDGCGQLQGGRPFAGVEQLDLQPAPEQLLPMAALFRVVNCARSGR